MTSRLGVLWLLVEKPTMSPTTITKSAFVTRPVVCRGLGTSRLESDSDRNSSVEYADGEDGLPTRASPAPPARSRMPLSRVPFVLVSTT